MEHASSMNMDDWRCEERCTLEWVRCVENEDGASICKTRERNCFSACQV